MKPFLWLIAVVVFIQSADTRGRMPILPTLADASVAEEPVFMRVELAEDTLKCPLGCHCQYAHFNELATARWIRQLQLRTKHNSQNAGMTPETELADIELHYTAAEQEYTDDYLANPFVKQATCILNADSNVASLLSSLPRDLQALNLLYTGIDHEKTMNMSMLSPLNQLNTLEVHGASSGENGKLNLVFDEPLGLLQYANFEGIRLLGSETSKRTKAPIEPNTQFKYKPLVEYYETHFESNEVTQAAMRTMNKLDFELLAEDNEILPYEVYKQEVRKSRMPNFYGWSALEVLRIHGCQLSELHWELFDGLSALQHLSLEHNNIAVLSAFALYGALHIKSLSLAHNQLHKLHYRALAGLLELEVLDLRDNRLEKLSELSFPPFPRLTRVDFRNNPLHYIVPATFWVMNETRVMHFGSTEAALELWDNHVFDSLHKLHTLDIGNVSIETLSRDVFKGLKSLDTLRLRGDIRSIEFDAFADMTKLRKLDLSHCNIQEISMDAFMGCKQLRILHLTHNNISHIPPGLFDDQQLQDVYLAHNKLRTLSHTFFQQPQLRLARLHDNPWQCSCDMYNWHPKVTNAAREASAKRCITDFTAVEKRLKCRLMDNYKHDRSLAPRCENFNGQSVNYVLHKRLHCGEGHVLREVHASSMKRGLPHWQKVAKLQLQKGQQHRNNSENGTPKIVHNELQLQRRQQNLVRNRNSLELALKSEVALNVATNVDDNVKRLDAEALLPNEI